MEGVQPTCPRFDAVTCTPNSGDIRGRPNHRVECLQTLHVCEPYRRPNLTKLTSQSSTLAKIDTQIRRSQSKSLAKRFWSFQKTPDFIGELSRKLGDAIASFQVKPFRRNHLANTYTIFPVGCTCSSEDRHKQASRAL